jgi:8-oxo-dGTP pyrophosphatase MutT (NUDIX family)
MSRTVIEAAGGIVWRDRQRNRIAVVHRTKHDDWTLPKGKLHQGEDWIAAALREVREETGCTVKLESFVGCISYVANGNPKVVLFWNMTVTEMNNFEPGSEIDRREWLSIRDALNILSYRNEKLLLEKITSIEVGA